jgi:hypothetical protein
MEISDGDIRRGWVVVLRGSEGLYREGGFYSDIDGEWAG